MRPIPALFLFALVPVVCFSAEREGVISGGSIDVNICAPKEPISYRCEIGIFQRKYFQLRRQEVNHDIKGVTEIGPAPSGDAGITIDFKNVKWKGMRPGTEEQVLGELLNGVSMQLSYSCAPLMGAKSVEAIITLKQKVVEYTEELSG